MSIYTRREAALILAGTAALGGQPSRALSDVEAFRSGIGHLSKRSQQYLLHLWNQGHLHGVLRAADVKSLMLSEGKTIDQLIVDLLPVAQIYSRPPITNYRVGAIIRGDRGDLYFGANLEVPSNVLSFSVHAEQAAASNAFMSGDSGIVDLAVTAAPCGHCRQFLYEMRGSQDLRVIIKDGPVTPLAALLPSPFGPKDLGLSGNPFSKGRSRLRLDSGEVEALTAQALDAAAKSYAPYSKSLSGVAVRSATGSVFGGSYIENAAFNPSLSPLQVALTAVVRSGEPFSNIVEVVLVELRDAAITQEAAAKSVLSALAPKAKLQLRTASLAV